MRAGRELDAGDVGYSLVTTRSLFEHRAVVVGAGRDELLAGLAEVVEGRPGVGVASGVAMPGGKTVFVFPGQGAQWLGMGRELCAGYPVFAAAFDAVVAELDRHLARPLREVVWGADAELLNTTEFAQPALFAVEVALYRLLESWGMRPGLVMGHSVGELSAAHVSGVLDLADAALLVVMRGRLMQALPGGGVMYAVQAGEQELRPLLGEQVSVAAVNGPGSVVLSGAREAVSVVVDRLAAQGRRVRRLAVSHAFHSVLMEPMLEQFRAVADEVYAGRPAIPVISNVTGQLVAEDYGSADYWVRHIREAVRFADSVCFAHSAGATRFVEVGPAGGLTSLIEESLAQVSVVAVPTLRKDRPEPFAVVGAVAQAFVRGAGVDWASVLAGCGGQRVGLPTYAFAHERFWLADRFGVGQQVCVGQVLADEAGPGAHEAAGAAVGQGFAARLQGLSDAEQQAAVQAMVCEHTAAVLGRDEAAQLDAGQAFSDAGLTSLSAVELRNRLKTLTGVTLSATTAFDYPTPTQLADHLLSHLHHQNPTGATPELDRVDALTDLFLQTCDAGRDDDGWQIVALAANGREWMTTPVPKREWKEVVLLAGGGSDVAVVCLPTLTVLSSPHAYLDVARAMAGRHSVHALSLPGFDPDDALPQDREVVLEGAAQAILHAVGDHPHLVLAGYSSGGVLAHALGSYLAERHQRTPLGVALIDTYLPSQIVNADNPDQVGVNETGALFSRRVTSMARELDQLNATRLTAAASYAALFGTWEPVVSAVPLLNMIAMDETAACERVRAERINRWRVATAEASYSVVEVPGDHFDMITTSSDATTTALHGWISGLIRAG